LNLQIGFLVFPLGKTITQNPLPDDIIAPTTENLNHIVDEPELGYEMTPIWYGISLSQIRTAGLAKFDQSFNRMI
jgi:hypothetical protein